MSELTMRLEFALKRYNELMRRSTAEEYIDTGEALALLKELSSCVRAVLRRDRITPNTIIEGIAVKDRGRE